MSVDIKHPKFFWISVFIITWAILGACSQNEPSVSKESFPISTTTLFEFPTAILTTTIGISTVPALVEAHSNPTITLSPKPTSRFGFTAIEIESGNEATVQTAFWSDGEKQIYYAITSQTESSVLAWFVYDIATQTMSPTNSPLRYDKSLWNRLEIPEPTLHPEIQGLVSPSGQYVLYTLPSETLREPATSEFWLANTDGTRKIKLFDNSTSLLSDAAWMPDESKVFFRTASEGPQRLQSADVQTGIVDPVPIAVDETWTLSPDGTSLAIYGIHSTNLDAGFRLFLISTSNLDTEMLALADASHSQFSWSQNSETLYYWLKSGDGSSLWLCSYNISSAKKTYLIKLSELEKTIDASLANHMKFVVSSSGKEILFWRPSLWLVRLP